MLIPNHPADERLAAWADADADARADQKLIDHLPTCGRCSDVVSQLDVLRAALANLPDLAPPRPLRLLPPVADAPASAGAAGWVRRLFAPVMTAGAALAIVGVVGTAAPMLQGQAAEVSTDVGSDLNGEAEGLASEAYATSAGAEAQRSAPALEPAASGLPQAGGADASPRAYAAGEGEQAPASTDGVATHDADRLSSSDEALDRPIWPMLLFTGIALIIGALLLRWILAPRAG